MVSWLQIKLESLIFPSGMWSPFVFDLKMSLSSHRFFRFCSRWRWREGQEGLYVDRESLNLSKMFNSHWQFLPETHTFKNYKTVRNTDTLLRSSRFLLLDPREHTSRVWQVCFDQALISYSGWENGGPKMFIQHDAPGQWLVSMWQSQNFKGKNFTKFEVKSFQVKNETPSPDNWLWSKDCCFLNIIR